MVEAVALVVGGEVVAIEGVGRFAADGSAGALVELDADGAGEGLLGGVHKGVEGAAQGAVPEAVVDELGVLEFELALVVGELALEAERFEVAMGVEEHDGGRALVGLAGLDADEAVLDHVDAADAVGSGEGVEAGDEGGRAEGFAVEGDGEAALESDFDVGGVVGGVSGVLGPLVDVGGRLDPGVFEGPGLGALSPEVGVVAVG